MTLKLVGVAIQKAERLLNLVICLLATRRFLGVQEIRAAVDVADGIDADALGHRRRHLFHILALAQKTQHHVA